MIGGRTHAVPSLLGFITTPSDGTVPFGVALVVAALGLAIGWVALRAYRRHDSLPMLFVGAGFLLAFWTPPALWLLYLGVDAVASFGPALRDTAPAAVGLAGQVARIAGFVCILYGLAMPRAVGSTDGS